MRMAHHFHLRLNEKFLGLVFLLSHALDCRVELTPIIDLQVGTRLSSLIIMIFCLE